MKDVLPHPLTPFRPGRTRGPSRGRSAAGGHGLLGVLVGLLLGTSGGAALSAGCASSDQVLEKKRRNEEVLADSGCNPGAYEDCFSGPAEVLGRGGCKRGTRTCDNDGAWGECKGESLPTAEVCNRTDDDCDGIVDNGFERDGAICMFKNAKGACRAQGTWKCAADGKASECDAPIIKPAEETCDSIDNDCDGETDEDSVPATQQSCSTGKAGVCDKGSNKCVNGKIQCVQNVQPGAEICNKLDDNCNRMVDEDCVSESDARKQRGG